jgi:hypothetical protein
VSSSKSAAESLTLFTAQVRTASLAAGHHILDKTARISATLAVVEPLSHALVPRRLLNSGQISVLVKLCLESNVVSHSFEVIRSSVLTKLVEANNLG